MPGSSRLEKGTRLYFVIESLADRSLTEGSYHFEITSGMIRDISSFKGSRTDEYVVPTVNRKNLQSCLEYVRVDQIGKRAFLTKEEAERAADKMSDDYEKKWGWMLRVPLVRPWRESGDEE